jgi:type I restriction enzyme S subunit
MTSLSEANLNNGAAFVPQGEDRQNPSAFPAYPAYKASRVEWVDTLPVHWGTVALKWVSRVFAGGTPDKTKAHYWENGSIPWLNSGTVNQVIISEPSAFITTEAFNSSSARWIPSGSLVMALAGQGKTKGMVAQLALRATCNQSMAAIIPSGNVKPRYLFWWLSSNYQSIRNMAGGDLREGLNLELIGDIPLLMPSEEEQTQIASFLDHEIACIDMLIEEQQRLIELLKEKRQAVISLSVTKGLEPTVSMKNSGVVWLGDVPAHWVIRKLKNLVSVRGGSTPSKEVERYWEGDIPWVSPKDMKSERISGSIDHVSGSAIEEGGLKIVKSGAILIVVRGMILIHSVPVAITDVDVTINQDIKAMTPGPQLSGDYLSLLLQGVRDAVFQYIDSSAHGTRKLEWERFELIDLPIPSHSEQIRIVGFIETQKRAIDDLVVQAASTITLMKERRSALISAAVTGKIDVRGWQPPASASSPESAQEAV